MWTWLREYDDLERPQLDKINKQITKIVAENAKGHTENSHAREHVMRKILENYDHPYILDESKEQIIFKS